MTAPAAPFYVENLRRARLARTARAAELAAARLEDLEHLAADRVTREAAAPRAGFPTVEAMERFCRRVGRHDLIQSLPLQRSAA
ncbi:hypothetical protein HMPREF0569_1572 [Micrococcus luteus SK58]|uniref:hypothetical protein n=1 Tax=Micrococcus luteus TaxID=1270 RepID=UPI0001C4FFD2|nr:hypothetical protein [Micrococcus luteus]EFD50319.1 hypothetical protein HMPREF0569_1572 [Micrococcus luteus SK58]